MQKKDLPYFGFLDAIDDAIKQSAIYFLTKNGDCLTMHHFNGTEDTITGHELVEDIVLRNGTFYTNEEAKSVSPFECDFDGAFHASVEYLRNEPRPTNPLFAERDWCTLSVYEYCYGMYLQGLIKNGELTYEDIGEKYESRKA